MNKKEFLIPQLFFWELKSHISDEHNQPCVSYARLMSSTTILHSHKYTITLFLPTHYLWVLTDSQKPRGKRPLCTHDKLTSFDGSLHTLFWINNYDVTSVLAKAPLVPLGCILHPAAGSLLTEKGTKPQFHVLWRMKKNTGWARTTQTAHAASIIFLSCFALWCVLNLKFLCFSLNTQKVGITQDAGLGPLQVTQVIPCCVCVVIVWFGRSRQGHTEVLHANQMTARELEGLILWKCHEHTHTHVHSSESAYMYVTCNTYTLVFQPRSVICIHTDNKEIHCAYKHFHRKTWIFMKNTGYMQQTPDMPLSVCTRHSKIWPTLCSGSFVPHRWSKRATGWPGAAIGNITATQQSPKHSSASTNTLLKFTTFYIPRGSPVQCTHYFSLIRCCLQTGSTFATEDQTC